MSAPALSDQFGRQFDYARIAVTERCNLRCVYCMPESGVDFVRGERLLTTEEIVRLVEILSRLGVSKLRFTGGEPLIRKDIVHLVSRASRLPAVEQVHITTNGILLRRYLDRLVDAGLSGVNISLDTLQEQRFLQITRRDMLSDVIAAIHSAVERLRTVKINVVAMRGVNDDELVDFARLTLNLPVTVRFIELMPFDSDQVWKTGRFLSVDRMKSTLMETWPQMMPLQGSATETWSARIPGGRGQVALIPAFTRSLCGQCNRIRVTADGRLRNCLYSESEYSLRNVLRGNGTDEDIIRVLHRGIHEKAEDGWVAQRASLKRFRVSMTQIGG